MTNNPSVTNLFSFQKLNENHCFLCGIELKEGKTREHVFAKWLQNRYNLWNHSVWLMNGTSIRYKNLMIPCCKACNGTHLSILEREIGDAFSLGVAGIRGLDEERIWQWISKIFYGILFRELFLKRDRKSSDNETIATQDQFEKLSTLHGYLQSIRHPLNFEAGKPWSIFIFRCHHYSSVDLDFDYHDVYHTLTFSIRMGEVGIIACLSDNGLLTDWFANLIEDIGDVALHPLQFNELAALVTYQASLINRGITSIVIGDDDDNGANEELSVVSLSPRGYSDYGVFLPANFELKAQILYSYWMGFGINLHDIFIPPSTFMTFLHNDDDSIKKFEM